MEKKTLKNKTIKNKYEKETMNRAGLIDGLPNSYNVNYVILRKKECGLCNKPITEDSIQENEIICTEEWDFFHKTCLNNNNIEIKHQRENDKTSYIKLIYPADA